MFVNFAEILQKRKIVLSLEDVINRILDFIIGKKLGASFPSEKLILKGYGIPYRFDRNSKGLALLFFIRDDAPSNFLKLISDCNIESISVYVELNLRKQKWFINGSHNLSKSCISTHCECLKCSIDEYSKSYQNFLFLGDYNATLMQSAWESFLIF